MLSRAVSSLSIAVAAGALALLSAGSAAAQQPAAPAGQPAAQPPLRIAVLDTRHVILNSEEGLRIQANLRKLSEAKQAELAQKDKQLGEEQEQLKKEEKQKGSSDTLDKRKAEWRQKVAMLQQAQLDFQRDMLAKETELTKPMLQKIGTIVKNIAAKDVYDVVVDKNAIVWWRNDLDITERVLQLYNQGDTGAPQTKPAPKKPAAPEKKKPAPEKKK
jgi:outer membrane protein